MRINWSTVFDFEISNIFDSGKKSKVKFIQRILQHEKDFTPNFAKFAKSVKFAVKISDGSGLPEPENPTRTRGILPNPKLPEPELFKISQDRNYPNPNFSRFQKPVATRTRN